MSTNGKLEPPLRLDIDIAGQRHEALCVAFNEQSINITMVSGSVEFISDCAALTAIFHTEEGQALSVPCRPVDSSPRLARLAFQPPGHSALLSLLISAQTRNNTDIPTSAESINQLAANHIDQLIELFLSDLDAHLIQTAAQSPMARQTRLLELKNQLHQHRKLIRDCIGQHIRLGEPDTHSTGELAPVNVATNMDELALVDPVDFEEWLSVEKIIRRAESRYFNPFACLEKRMAILMRDPGNDHPVSFSVSDLCHSLSDVLVRCNISKDLLPIIYKQFDTTVISNVGDLYDHLNLRLKKLGIAPDAEKEVRQQHNEKIPTNQSHSSADRVHTPLHAAPQDDGRIYASAHAILQLLKNPDTTTHNSHSVDDVLEALTRLNPVNQPIPSLQQALVNTGGMRLSARVGENLLLIDSIFENAKQSLHHTPSLRKLVDQIQIPVARTALSDGQFFTATDHPARQLINLLVRLCQNSDFPNLALERKLNSIINDLVEQGSTHTAYIDAIQQLNLLLAQQQSAYRRNTERVAQNYRGRQRVSRAEQTVLNHTLDLLPRPKTPYLVKQLLERGWRELLQLTLLKHGEQAPQWQNALQNLRDLLSFYPQSDGNTERCELSINDSNLAHHLLGMMEHQLDDIFPGRFDYQPVLQQIALQLDGEQTIDWVATDILEPMPPDEEQYTEQLDKAHPDLARWLKRTTQMEVGDEFGYLDDETGERDIKLAWISDSQQHFVFVNRRGQKILDIDRIDVANALKNGLTPIEGESSWQLVERSMYTTVQQAYEKLAFNSSHDELTGLFNRKECEKQIAGAISEAKSRACSIWLMYIDIDRFSLVNDLFGHVAGDQFLKQIGHLLLETVGDEATVGRMAGNEFMALMEGSDAEIAKVAAKRVLTNIDQAVFEYDNNPVELSASIGIVEINKFTDSCVSVLRNAVSALRLAKQGGGNRLHVYELDAEQQERREVMLSWINRLNSVLDSDRLVLRGQPIVPLYDSEEGAHYEILVAVREDDGALTSPASFIEAVESYNRMQRVDRWVIENVFTWMNNLASSNEPVPHVSINLSGNSINDDQFLDFLLDALNTRGIDAGKICFEVTETATIANLAAAADFIREVKKLGCRFSLDDFGSGNASYQYLKHLPIDFIKIDGLFVKNIQNNSDDLAMVKSINEIAHLMNKKTVAEFTENAAIVEIIRSIGVDYAQGYALGYPVLLTELTPPGIQI